MSMDENVRRYYDEVECLTDSGLYAANIQLHQERKQLRDALEVVNKKVQIVNAEIAQREDEKSQGWSKS